MEEWARNVQWVFQDGNIEFDRLEGWEPTHADWHAKVDLYKIHVLVSVLVRSLNNFEGIIYKWRARWKKGVSDDFGPKTKIAEFSHTDFFWLECHPSIFRWFALRFREKKTRRKASSSVFVCVKLKQKKTITLFVSWNKEWNQQSDANENRHE